MRIPLGAFLLLFSFIINAQDDEWRVIPSVTEWIEEINSWPDSIYIQNKIQVNFDYSKDSALVATSWEEVGALTGDSIKQKLVVLKPVRVFGLNFSGEYNGRGYEGRWIGNLHFKENFEFYELDDSRFGFINCQFDGLYQPRLMKTRFFFRHLNCVFNGTVNINNPQEPTPFSFENCTFSSFFNVSAIDATPSLRLEGCQLELASISDKMESIYIDSCNFRIGLSMNNLKVGSAIDIYQSNFGVLNIQGTDLPPNNSYISFDSLQNKLGLLWGAAFWEMADEIAAIRKNEFTKQEYRDSVLSMVYRAQTDEEIEYKPGFDQLIACYYKLLNIYKIRGEMDSYNSAYIEMRDKQTARTKLLYEQDPSFNRYFDWQINRFTKAFSNYGTRPAKAIVIFFQVVLAFSVFYFFFPSTWNRTNNRAMMKRLSYLGSYFRSKEGLSDLFEKETKDEYRDYEEFREFMNSSEKELPVYFKWLSKPLYSASVSRFNLTRSVLRRTDILNGMWSELPAGKKATTSFLIGLYLLFYLIYVLIVRALNAITLSLNAFSTLGFGEIPTRGLARYVTIIQGFVGWFLLSIFLVSLIGQILN